MSMNTKLLNIFSEVTWNNQLDILISVYYLCSEMKYSLSLNLNVLIFVICLNWACKLYQIVGAL